MIDTPKTLLDAVRYYTDLKVCFTTMLDVKWPNGTAKRPGLSYPTRSAIASNSAATGPEFWKRSRRRKNTRPRTNERRNLHWPRSYARPSWVPVPDSSTQKRLSLTADLEQKLHELTKPDHPWDRY